jgi:hypothetical protein
MFKKRHLNYNFSQILNADYTQHIGSCIKHQVHELTDIYDQYGGFSETYRVSGFLLNE